MWCEACKDKAENCSDPSILHQWFGVKIMRSTEIKKCPECDNLESILLDYITNQVSCIKCGGKGYIQE